VTLQQAERTLTLAGQLANLRETFDARGDAVIDARLRTYLAFRTEAAGAGSGTRRYEASAVPFLPAFSEEGHHGAGRLGGREARGGGAHLPAFREEGHSLLNGEGGSYRGIGYCLSSARLSSRTLTAGSPKNPSARPSVFCSTRVLTSSTVIPRVFATRGV